MPKRAKARRTAWSMYDSTAHLGSKRGFFRLRMAADSQGKRHVIWPERERNGRQAEPMTEEAREANYARQNGPGRELTSAQRRRLRHKAGRAEARQG